MILSYNLEIKIYGYHYIHSVCFFKSSTGYSIIATVLNVLLSERDNNVRLQDNHNYNTKTLQFKARQIFNIKPQRVQFVTNPA